MNGDRETSFPDLTRLFSPRSVVLVGASGRASTIGRIALDNIARHSRFDGELFLINRSRPEIDGMPCFPSVADLPAGGQDVALVVVPARETLAALRDCAAKGIRFAIVITSGFAELGPEGAAAEREMRDLATASGMRVYGPNCPGLTNLKGRIGLNISPSFKADTVSGPIGLVTQGGGLGRAVVQGGDRGCGIGLWGSAGNEADLDFADLAHHMIRDPDIRVIAGIVEGFKSGPRFVAVAKAALAAGKPIVLLKIGRTAAGVAAALSHTASMAGEDAVNDAIFRQYGVVRVSDIDELHETAAFLVRAEGKRPPRSVAVATFSGGAGTLAADLLSAGGIGLTALAPATEAALREIAPDFIAVGNPLDLTTQIFAEPDLHRRALATLAADPGTDAIVLPIPADYGDITLNLARDLEAAQAASPETLFVPLWMSERHGTGYQALQAAGIPPFRSVERAAAALRRAVAFADARTKPGDAPPAALPLRPPPDTGDEAAAKAWLAAHGVAIPRETFALDPPDAGAAAAAIGGPVALKIVSPDIAHKSDVGGVELGLVGAGAVEAAARAMRDRVAAAQPAARQAGFLVSEMVTGGIELVVGMHRDPVFGPILTVGFGGVLVEVLRDVVHLHLPVGEATIREALGRLRGRALLEGVRGRPPVDLGEVARAIATIAAAAYAARHELAEVEANPLIVGAAGRPPTVVDALVRARSSDDPAKAAS